MISEAILDWLFGAAEWVVDLLPDSSIDLEPPSFATDAAAVAAYVLDLTYLSSAIGVILALEAGIIAVRVGLWVYEHIPGKAT